MSIHDEIEWIRKHRKHLDESIEQLQDIPVDWKPTSIVLVTEQLTDGVQAPAAEEEAISQITSEPNVTDGSVDVAIQDNAEPLILKPTRRKKAVSVAPDGVLPNSNINRTVLLYKSIYKVRETLPVPSIAKKKENLEPVQEIEPEESVPSSHVKKKKKGKSLKTKGKEKAKTKDGKVVTIQEESFEEVLVKEGSEDIKESLSAAVLPTETDPEPSPEPEKEEEPEPEIEYPEIVLKVIEEPWFPVERVCTFII